MNSKKHREFKDALFQQLARAAKALANPHRLEIVDLLAQGERSVEDIAEQCGMSIANTSQHLQELRAALLVKVRKAGLRSFYSLSEATVFSAWQAIRDLGQQQLSEIDRLLKTYVSEREQFESVSADELMRRIKQDDVVVLDVRPRGEFEAGHIRGALSLPVQELRRRISELDPRSEIIAYCRGPFCVFADEAVSLLRKRGFQARRLDVGLPDWKAGGRPTSVGTGH